MRFQRVILLITILFAAAMAKPAPEPRPAPFLKAIQDFGQGFVDGAVGLVEGVANVILHPVDTVKNLGKAISDPIGTIKAIGSSIANACSENAAKCLGRATFEIGSTVATAGLSKGASIAKAADMAGDVGRGGKILNGLDKAGDASNLNKAVQAGKAGGAIKVADAFGDGSKIAANVDDIGRVTSITDKAGDTVKLVDAVEDTSHLAKAVAPSDDLLALAKGADKGTPLKTVADDLVTKNTQAAIHAENARALTLRGDKVGAANELSKATKLNAEVSKSVKALKKIDDVNNVKHATKLQAMADKITDVGKTTELASDASKLAKAGQSGKNSGSWVGNKLGGVGSAIKNSPTSLRNGLARGPGGNFWTKQGMALNKAVTFPKWIPLVGGATKVFRFGAWIWPMQNIARISAGGAAWAAEQEAFLTQNGQKQFSVVQTEEEALISIGLDPTQGPHSQADIEAKLASGKENLQAAYNNYHYCKAVLGEQEAHADKEACYNWLLADPEGNVPQNADEATIQAAWTARETLLDQTYQNLVAAGQLLAPGYDTAISTEAPSENQSEVANNPPPNVAVYNREEGAASLGLPATATDEQIVAAILAKEQLVAKAYENYVKVKQHFEQTGDVAIIQDFVGVPRGSSGADTEAAWVRAIQVIQDELTNLDNAKLQVGWTE